jgi:hypothetical protein
MPTLFLRKSRLRRSPRVRLFLQLRVPFIRAYSTAPNVLSFICSTTIISPMSSRMLQDFRSIEPRSWEELAAAARFLAGVYGQSFRVEAMALSAGFGMPAIEQLAASFLARHYASLHDQAYAIHLGARAASMEGRSGGFGTPAELISRITEAGGSGAIIHGFVNAARTIVVTNTLFKGDMSADVSEARDLASQDLFDGTLRRIEEHDRLLGPIRPKPAMILQLIGGELGVFPHPLTEAILGVLNFKGGPK